MKESDPVFPTSDFVMKNSESIDFDPRGINIKTFAAIMLRVPNSGEKWLDEMIEEANRRDVSKNIIPGIISNGTYSLDDQDVINDVTFDALQITEEILRITKH